MKGIPSVQARLACIHTASHPGRAGSFSVALPASAMALDCSPGRGAARGRRPCPKYPAERHRATPCRSAKRERRTVTRHRPLLACISEKREPLYAARASLAIMTLGCAQRLQRDQLIALGARRVRSRSGQTLEGIENSELFADFADRRQYLFAQQPDARHAILKAHRPLALEDAEDAGP